MVRARSRTRTTGPRCSQEESGAGRRPAVRVIAQSPKKHDIRLLAFESSVMDGSLGDAPGLRCAEVGPGALTIRVHRQVITTRGAPGDGSQYCPACQATPSCAKPGETAWSLNPLARTPTAGRAQVKTARGATASCSPVQVAGRGRACPRTRYRRGETLPRRELARGAEPGHDRAGLSDDHVGNPHPGSGNGLQYSISCAQGRHAAAITASDSANASSASSSRRRNRAGHLRHRSR